MSNDDRLDVIERRIEDAEQALKELEGDVDWQGDHVATNRRQRREYALSMAAKVSPPGTTPEALMALALRFEAFVLEAVTSADASSDASGPSSAS